MSIEKMREEFEAACVQHANDAGFPEYDYGFERSSEDGNCYLDSHTQAAWWAWQASRAALVIELPPLKNSTSYYDGGDQHDEVLRRCRTAIEAAGVKVKP